MLLLNRWGQSRGELLRLTFEYAPPWSLGMFPVLDLAQDKYGDAIADLMVKTPALRERPYFLAQLVQVLAGSQKMSDALEEATALTERFPDFCEGRALLAGVLADQGKSAEAGAAAQPLLADAADGNPRASQLRCAAMAAAALGDAAATAEILDRISAREEYRRGWAFARFGQSGRLLLMGHMYPWTKVAGAPAVVAARERMDTLLEQLRQNISVQLGPVAYQ
jgi:hypothetical protein